MFQLTDEETIILSRCKNFTLNRGSGRGKNVKYNPYAFSEQGIYMLMTVLRGDLAIKQSRALIRAFKQIKDYIIENQMAEVMDRLSNVVTRSELSEIMNEFGEPHIKRGYLVLNGEPFKADLVYDEIYRQARKSIYIVDNYIGIKTLELLSGCASEVEITIFSDNLAKGVSSNIYADFCKEDEDRGKCQPMLEKLLTNPPLVLK